MGIPTCSDGAPGAFHPPLKMLGIGNEQWGPQYLERLVAFTDAIKSRYPDILLVSTTGPVVDDERFYCLQAQLQMLNVQGHGADLLDQHMYESPEWFLAQVQRFDHYLRTGPKVLFGEYAAQSDKVCSPDNRNSWACALAEAAFMLGLERNADVVQGACYGPLLAHKDAWQWTPNLLWFDNLQVVATPSYYVQQLFATHRGDVVLPTHVASSSHHTDISGTVASAMGDLSTGVVIIKIVNAGAVPISATIDLKGASATPHILRATVLSGHPEAENAFDQPHGVVPTTPGTLSVHPPFGHWIPPFSLTILSICLAA